MTASKLLIDLEKRLESQIKFMDKCGGSLSGYIATYGDPGIPPLDKDGNPATFTVKPEHLHIFTSYEPVPGKTNTFYKRHLGDGGTKIYEADHNALMRLKQCIVEVRGRYHHAHLTAHDIINRQG